MLSTPEGVVSCSFNYYNGLTCIIFFSLAFGLEERAAGRFGGMGRRRVSLRIYIILNLHKITFINLEVAAGHAGGECFTAAIGVQRRETRTNEKKRLDSRFMAG